MAEEKTVKTKYELEAERAATEARDRALKRARERDAVSEGFKAHTEGEKRFNDLTYTLVGYFGVTSFSVFLTWLLKDTKFFSKHFNNAVDALTNKMDFLYKASPKNRHDFFETFMTIGTLFTGGTIVSVFPVKWLEDNKAKLVKHFDKEIYGEDVVNSDPDIQAAHQIMDEQPKQTWKSVLGSRVTAFVATYGTMLAIGTNTGFISRHIGTSFDTLGIQFGRWAGRILNHGNSEKIEQIEKAIVKNREIDPHHVNLRKQNEHDTGWTRILSYAGMDALYTVITAVGLFVSTRVLAPVFDKAGLENWGKHHSSDHKQHTPVESKPIIPLEDRAHDEPPTNPRVKVEHAEHSGRLKAEPEKHVGAPA